VPQSDLPSPNRHHEVGPIAYWVGVVYTMFAPIFALGAYQMKPIVTMAMSLTVIGVLPLLPRDRLSSLKVSLPVVGYVAWAVASYTWAEAPDSTRLYIQTAVLFVVAISVAGSYLPRDVFLRAFLRSMQILLFITLFAVLTTAEGRAETVQAGLGIAPGWRGFFVFKNIMAPVIVLAMITVLAFEMNRKIATVFVLITCVLMAGAQSATGTVALVLALAVWYWTGLLSRGDEREQSTMKVATPLVAVVLVGIALNSVAALVGALGKDLTFTGRTEIWSLTFPLIADRPIHGFGLAGPFIELRSQIAMQTFRTLNYHAQHAHNMIFDLLVTLGVVGLVIVSILIAGTVRAAWVALRRSPRLARWVLCSTSILFLMGFGEPMLTAQFIGLFAAMRVALMNESDDASVESSYRDVAAPLARDL